MRSHSMIKRKVIELENIGFGRNEEWERVDATATIDDQMDEPELEIKVGEIAIAIPVEDIFYCLQELGIDVSAWVPQGQ